MLERFFGDMHHMTEGEKLVAYWPLWAGIGAIGIIVVILMHRNRQ